VSLFSDTVREIAVGERELEMQKDAIKNREEKKKKTKKTREMRKREKY